MLRELCLGSKEERNAGFFIYSKECVFYRYLVVGAGGATYYLATLTAAPSLEPMPAYILSMYKPRTILILDIAQTTSLFNRMITLGIDDIIDLEHYNNDIY